MKRILLQPAYILHTRSYKETSLLVEIFTLEHGRLTLIAKGVRQSKSAWAGLLQPFVPLLVSWTGKTELMTLLHAETKGAAKQLRGECLFAGFYLNELLMYLLQKWDAHEGLFKAYDKAVSALQTEKLEQKILRTFEKYLLEELGYGVLPKSETALQNTFLPDKFYRFVPEQGLLLCEPCSLEESPSLPVFSGKSLIAIARDDWDETSLSEAKRLTRFVLTPLLAGKRINSRQLFL